MEKDAEVDADDGSRYGTGGAGDEKVLLVRSRSAANRLRLRFLMIRGIRLKLFLAFFKSMVFPG